MTETTEHRLPKHAAGALALAVLLALGLTASCVSRLYEAKLHLTEGRKYGRRYAQDKAAASFKRARLEAAAEAAKHPSAQAFLIKGLAEMELGLWDEAGSSLRSAFALGFDKGEEWAGDLALFGAARSLQQMGLEEAADRVYLQIMNRAKFKPAVLLAAQHHAEAELKKALEAGGRERGRILKSLLRKMESLLSKDPACGYYHYIVSQVSGHTADYARGFEEAVMAKELGLPSVEISRDNDLQIVFCLEKRKAGMARKDWDVLRASFECWAKKWGWSAYNAPDWKKR